MEFAIPILNKVNKEDGFYPDPSEFTYWKMRENRTFVIDYEIEDDYMLMDLSKIIIQMNMEEKDVPKEELKPIYIYIHSYGGDLEQSFYFADLCISSRIPIITVAMGVAMSAGFLIFLAGHKRYAFAHSQLLVHSGSAGFQGTAEQIEEAQKNYKKQLMEMKTYILARTKIDEKTFNKNKAKDWYLTAEELEKFAVIDKFITDFSDILN
jgi:ATP-dependent Clp protease protease subunit